MADYKKLGINVERTTRKSSISGVHVDHYAFRRTGKVWMCKVLRKDSLINLSGTETLAVALSALAEAHGLTGFENAPKRVDSNKAEWVLSGEVFDGNYPLVS